MTHFVLVVDDDPLVLEVIAGMLDDLGCGIVTAASGAEDLDRLSSNNRITILITDINMPEMDGYELVERATRISQRCGSFNCLVASGRDGFPMIRKPFSEKELRETMKRTTGVC